MSHNNVRGRRKNVRRDGSRRCSCVLQCIASVADCVRDEVGRRSPLSASTSRSCPFVFESVPRRSSQQCPPARPSNKDNGDAGWPCLQSVRFVVVMVEYKASEAFVNHSTRSLSVSL